MIKTRTFWEKLVDNRPSCLIGLDIGSSAVKMVVAGRAGGHLTIQSIHQIELPESPASAEARLLAVQQCLRKSGLKNPQAVCAVAGPQVVLSRFEFPPLPPEAIRQAVELEAQQICPFEYDQSVFDYQLIEPANAGSRKAGNESPVRGFLVLVPRQSVRERQDWLRQAGGKTVYVDMEGLAALNCLGRCRTPDPAQIQVLLNMGSEFTHVLVRGRDAIPFIRSLPFGGRALAGELGRCLGQSPAGVRELLFQNHTLGAEISAALKTAAGKWITDINETLRYALLQNPGAALSRIHLCGGWALSAALVNLLSESLPAAVEVFNPFDELLCAESVNEDENLLQSGPVFAVAAGLAMRAME